MNEPTKAAPATTFRSSASFRQSPTRKVRLFKTLPRGVLDYGYQPDAGVGC